MAKKMETNSLPVNLTQSELLEYSKALAKHTQDLRDKENRKKEVVKMIDAEISGHKAHIDALSLKIANGYEYRDVECTWEYNKEHDRKILYRNDTGEVIKREPLTTADLQKSFI